MNYVGTSKRTCRVSRVVSSLGVVPSVAQADVHSPMGVCTDGGGAVASGAGTQLASGVSSLSSVSPTYYHVWKRSRYVRRGTFRSYGDSGGTLGRREGYTRTISGSFTGGTSVEAGVVFAKASVQASVTIGASKSVTTESSYTWEVPRSQKVGWLEMGAYGYSIVWKKGHYRSPCTWVTTKSGAAVGVTKNPWFHHS